MAATSRPKNIISKEEYLKLQKELIYKKAKRSQIAEEFQEANSLGDDRENFQLDAIIAKQRVHERRIQELEGFLMDCVVEKEDAEKKSNVVKIGSIVEVEKEGKVLKLRIVTPEMILVSRKPGDISSDSELGKALLDKTKGDVATLKLAEKEAVYRVKKIS